MKKLQILVLLCFAFTMFTSCGSDIDCTDEAALEAAVEPQFDAVLAAITAYNGDNSEDNCKDLRKALDEYKDALKDVEECVEDADRAEFDTVLESIEEQKAALEC